MKCAHPYCNRGIGLVSYRRPFARARFCSKQCRDRYLTEKEPAVGHRPAAYFERLFLLPPVANSLLEVVHSSVRMRGR